MVGLCIGLNGFGQTNTSDSTSAIPVDTTQVIEDSTSQRNLLPDQVNVFFNQDKKELKKGEIITNVMEIINNSSESQRFIVDILAPGGWRNFTEEKIFELGPQEKAFLPVLLIPTGLMNSNTEIIINTFLINDRDEQIATNYFTLFTKKQISWEASINDGQRIYFRNGETTKDFDYQIANTGNFTQDIMVTHSLNTGFMLLKDTNNQILDDQAKVIQLESLQDTTFTYRASVLDYKNRNFKKVSLLNHNPNANLEYKKYSVYINSSEPKGLGKDVYKKGNKVDLIKLPNVSRVNPYGYPNLPLTIEANIQNVLSDYTFMSVNLRGYKQLSADASLSYYAQLNYSGTYWNTNVYTTVPWYVGYHNSRTSIEVGQVNGNMLGLYNFGQGIKASHKYFNRHKTSAFYVKDPGIFKTARTESYGIGHEFKLSEAFKISGKAGRSENKQTNTTIDAISLNPSFRIGKSQHFNFFGATTNRSLNAPGVPPTPVQGYLVGGNYSTFYFDNKVRTNLSARYNDPNYSYGAIERLTGTHRSSIKVNRKLEMFINNNYQNLTSYNTIGNNTGYYQNLLYNNVIFSTPTRFGSFQPGVFYDFTDYLDYRLHSRGLSMRFSNFDYNKNFMSSFFIRAGYNDPIDYPEISDFFSMEMSALVRLRVWNLSANYQYGANSNISLLNMQREGITPQNLRVSLQNQYQFKNPHFILESVVTYRYNNRFDGHNLGLYPQMYYYTNSGWRFGVQAFFNLSSSDYSSVYDSYNLNNTRNDQGPTSSSNFNMNVNVKKDVGIPIPFVKNKHASNHLVAFYDVNGNHQREKDEPLMENVIVRIGNNEVITNKKGEASLENVPVGRYSFSTISLDKIEGWFANIDDSITVQNSGLVYVPFVRGVKVYGDVNLDRQEIAIADKDKVFDMSRIKVSAVGEKTYNTLTDIDGHFEFYLPNGNYTITMDEGILDGTYKLSRNNIPLELKSTQDGVYVSFYIVEKRRKVKFKSFDKD